MTNFWALGHMTEYRDESIINLKIFKELSNQRVYMLANTNTQNSSIIIVYL